VIWEVHVKTGEILRATTAELDVQCQLTVADKPDFTKYDLSKPETNPFYPHADAPEDPSFDRLSARAGDQRVALFRAKRDATLWLSTNAAGKPNSQFTLNIVPGTTEYAADKTNTGYLRIADTNWWAFDAKPGDVMSLTTVSPKFADLLVVRDPDMNEIRHFEAPLDQTSDRWRVVVQKPGRYLMSVSSVGNGGSGEYSLARQVFHSKEFSKSSPAKGEISNGEVQVWTFKAQPNDPLLIHWASSNSNYEVAIYDEKGNQTELDLQRLDDHNEFGILKVDQPRTFVLVLSGNGSKASYDIDLGPVPGFRAAPAAKKVVGARP
jgi:hypothetical protein